MYRKEITYTNYNDEEVTETFYFNISKAEIYKLDAEHHGQLKEHLDEIVKSKDAHQIYEMLVMLIKLAYGEKSADGKHFTKKHGELADEFEESPAFEALLDEFVRDDTAASAFIEGILPKVKTAQA